MGKEDRVGACEPSTVLSVSRVGASPLGDDQRLDREPE